MVHAIAAAADESDDIIFKLVVNSQYRSYRLVSSALTYTYCTAPKETSIHAILIGEHFNQS